MAGKKHLLLMALKESGGRGGGGLVCFFFFKGVRVSQKWEFQSVAEVRHTLVFKGNLNPVSASTIFLSTSTSCWIMVETEKLAEI